VIKKCLLIGLALLLAACAPRSNVIDTGVSGTLTALAPTAVLSADRATSTAVPTLAPPTLAATAPKATAVELAQTASATDATAEAGPTEAPSLGTATVGDLIFEDTFDSAGPWTVGETDQSNVAISGGVMTFTQKTPGSFAVRIIGKQGDNFYAEVTATLLNNCTSGDRFGLMFRVQDPSNYYALQVNCEGDYRLMRYVADASTPIVDWTPSSAIQRGKQSSNTLAVTARGGSLLLAINGTSLNTVNDETFASGRFGLMVGANASKNFAVVFDDLKAYKVP
jgi:hypothetical protein